jgi:HD superfamily phosphohydrolase
MYRQVYFHKTVTAGESMLTAMLRRARDLAREGTCPGIARESGPARLIAADEVATVADFLAFDDVVMQGWLARWAECGDEVLKDLAGRLRTRRLFKTMEVENFDEQDMMVRMRVEEARDAVRGAGLDPEYYLLFVESEDTPYHPYNPRTEGAGTTIWTENPNNAGELCDVKDVSPTIRVFTESPYSIWRAVFPGTSGGKDLRDSVRRALQG